MRGSKYEFVVIYGRGPAGPCFWELFPVEQGTGEYFPLPLTTS